MNDMTAVIAPKSDQWNADDLIAGPMTITIREVRIRAGEEQPVSIYVDGSDKAYRPCKSMSRALVQMWGPDASRYIGRSLTLYRDPKVRFGKDEVGGIRISHATHIDGPQKLMLTATRGQRKPFLVEPLQIEQAEDAARKWADGFITAVNSAGSKSAVEALRDKHATRLAKLDDQRPELHAECVHALSNKLAAFAVTDDLDGDWQEGPSDSQRGEAHTEPSLRDLIEAANDRKSWEAAKEAVCAAELSDDERLALSRALETKKGELVGGAK